MPFDKRECPNGHWLLWQNRQTVNGHEAVPDRSAAMPENPRNPSLSRLFQPAALPTCYASAFVLFYSTPLAC
jgi:hypothetical protein